MMNRSAKIGIEQIKLAFDHTKHLTTLSVGSMVVIVAFYEKLSTSRHWKPLVSISLGCFVLSIISGLAAQVGTLELVEKEEPKNIFIGAAFIVSWVGFGLAIIALGVYGIRNF